MDKKIKILKNIINIIFYVLMGLLIVCLVSILVFKLIYKEKIPRLFNYYALEVVSGSMKPTLEVGDYILVKKQDDYNVGDIITYEYDGNIITHRIYKINGNNIITMGDANNTEDEPIKKDAVLGKYILTSNFLGYLIKFRFIILALIALLYLIWKTIMYLIEKK